MCLQASLQERQEILSEVWKNNTKELVLCSPHYCVSMSLRIVLTLFLLWYLLYKSIFREHWQSIKSGITWRFTSRSSPVWCLHPSCCGPSRVGICHFLRPSGTSSLEYGSGSSLPGMSSFRLPWAPCRLRSWTETLKFALPCRVDRTRRWVKFGNKYLISGGRASLGLLLFRGLLRFWIDAWNNSTALGGATPGWSGLQAAVNTSQKVLFELLISSWRPVTHL